MCVSDELPAEQGLAVSGVGCACAAFFVAFEKSWTLIWARVDGGCVRWTNRVCFSCAHEVAGWSCMQLGCEGPPPCHCLWSRWHGQVDAYLVYSIIELREDCVRLFWIHVKIFLVPKFPS